MTAQMVDVVLAEVGNVEAPVQPDTQKTLLHFKYDIIIPIYIHANICVGVAQKVGKLATTHQ